MVARWGMSDRLGPVHYRISEEHVFLGKEIQEARDFSEAHRPEHRRGSAPLHYGSRTLGLFEPAQGEPSLLDRLAEALLRARNCSVRKLRSSAR